MIVLRLNWQQDKYLTQQLHHNCEDIILKEKENGQITWFTSDYLLYTLLISQLVNYYLRTVSSLTSADRVFP